MRHEQVRVILAYSMRAYPTESFPEGGKNVFACYRKWVPGETAATPLERADVDRAKPVRNEEDDLRWALEDNDDDDDDDDDEEKVRERAPPERGAEAGEKEQRKKEKRRRRRRSSANVPTCALCARPERQKDEASSAKKWEGRLFTFTGRAFHAQCLLWSSGLDIEKGDDGGRPDVAEDDVQQLLIDSADRKCSRCGEGGASTGCALSSCKNVYHFLCARRAGCAFAPSSGHEFGIIRCPQHIDAELEESEGEQEEQEEQEDESLYDVSEEVEQDDTSRSHRIDGRLHPRKRQNSVGGLQRKTGRVAKAAERPKKRRMPQPSGPATHRWVKEGGVFKREAIAAPSTPAGTPPASTASSGTAQSAQPSAPVTSSNSITTSESENEGGGGILLATVDLLGTVTLDKRAAPRLLDRAKREAMLAAIRALLHGPSESSAITGAAEKLEIAIYVANPQSQAYEQAGRDLLARLQNDPSLFAAACAGQLRATTLSEAL